MFSKVSAEPKADIRARDPKAFTEAKANAITNIFFILRPFVKSKLFFVNYLMNQILMMGFFKRNRKNKATGADLSSLQPKIQHSVA